MPLKYGISYNLLVKNDTCTSEKERVMHYVVVDNRWNNVVDNVRVILLSSSSWQG